MMGLYHSSDSSPSILSCSPKIAIPIKTLDECSPTAPIRAFDDHSLTSSSPIRQDPSSPAKPLSQIENPGESSSSPSDKTLITPSSVDIEENECRDIQIMQQTQISPANNNKSLQIASTSYCLDSDRDSYNRPPKRYMASLDYESDNDLKIESTKPVEAPWSYLKIEPTGVGAGLDNSGNTCFIASVLQCFTHTVPLIESLRSYKSQIPCNCGSEKFCVMQVLRDHTELALRSSGYNLAIDQFRDNLNHFSSDFQINYQEDAHEFLQSFLNKLKRCCLDPRNKPGSISTQDVNIVDHVFGGRLMSRLHCCNCNSFSDTFEPSLGWSLEIEDVDNLWSALESFTCVEKLEDQFTCDNCNEKVSKEKQLTFDKLPLIATFHLKRFKNDGVNMEKIFKQVGFPLELDLLPYMNTNENPEVSTKYHLYAFVEHIGNGVSFGHYSSYVRSALETWHNFDDAKVMKISEECVLAHNAYILFYAREGTKWFSTAYEELKPLFDATPLSLSPTSVLETTFREESASDHQFENVGNPNYACNGSVAVPIMGVNYDEPQEEVFDSAEPSSKDFNSLKAADESEKPFAETTHQKGNKATMYDVSAPVLKSLKRKGRFEIQRSHLQMKKRQEERDPKGKGIAASYLIRGSSSYRSRMLIAALGSSPIKKKKLKRSLGRLHTRL